MGWEPGSVRDIEEVDFDLRLASTEARSGGRRCRLFGQSETRLPPGVLRLAPWGFVGLRRQTDEDGAMISEWITSMDSLREFFG
jgi:hypothetical protein